MEEVRRICMPLMIAAMFFCLYGIWYIKRWQRKNPWFKQDDDNVRLSPQERAYRQNERRKYSNVPFMVFGAVFACILLMVLLLQKEIGGSWYSTTDWIVIPFLGTLFLVASGIKRK